MLSTPGCGVPSDDISASVSALTTCLVQFQVVFFKASYAPKFQKGSSLIIAFCVLLAIFTCTARFFQLRDERRAPREARASDHAAEDEVVKDSKQDDDLEPGMTSTISRG